MLPNGIIFVNLSDFDKFDTEREHKAMRSRSGSKNLNVLFRAATFPIGSRISMKKPKSEQEHVRQSELIEGLLGTQKVTPIGRSKFSTLPFQAPLVEFKPAKPAQIKTASDLGLLVQHLRKAKYLTQQQLADLAGVGRRFLSELENGKESLELAKALRVAAALGIDIIARQR
jgi:HTH-type transcriptional regulator / antitoxin HipB